MRRKASGKLDIMRGSLSLRALSDALTVTEIREVPETETVWMSRWSREGQLAQPLGRKKLEVQVTVFAKAWEAIDRTRLYGKLCAFCLPGAYTFSHRPGETLYVVTAEVSGLPGVTAWTGTFTLLLRAALLPYFVREPETRVLEGRELLEEIAVPEGAGVLCEIEGINQQAAEMTECLVETYLGEERLSMIYVPGLTLSAGESIRFSLDSHLCQQIRAGGVSVLGKRTAASSDTLVFTPGKTVLLHLAANRRARWEVKLYGLSR